MIKSIEFKEGGYITPRKEKMVLTESGESKIKEYKKTHKESDYDRLTDIGWVRRVRLYENEDYHYVDQGYKNPQLVDNLLGKKFVFEPHKINVIFGENAAGKSTIINTLAAYCQCGDADNLDGWTNINFVNPLSSHSFLSSSEENDEKYVQQVVEDDINRLMKNNAVVEWDGIPVYNDSFSNRKMTGWFGELTGSVLDSTLDEALWLTSRRSLGEKSIAILCKMIPKLEKPFTLEDCLKVASKRTPTITKYGKVYQKALIQRLKRLNSGFSGEPVNTFMFDEIDKSMSISNVVTLYTKILPSLVEKTGCQIIIVSHSPVIITEQVYDSRFYNIINVTEGYAEECKSILSGFKF